MLEYLALPLSSASIISSRVAPSVSAAWYRYCPCPASSCTLASKISLRRKEGARVIQAPSGSIPTISLWACCEIMRISWRRYSARIQSPGSIFSPRAMRASKAPNLTGSSFSSMAICSTSAPYMRSLLFYALFFLITIHCSLITALFRVHPDRLDLGVEVDSFLAHLAAEAGHLVTAKRCGWVDHAVAVDPHCAALDSVGKAVGFADIAGPHPGR